MTLLPISASVPIWFWHHLRAATLLSLFVPVCVMAQTTVSNTTYTSNQFVDDPVGISTSGTVTVTGTANVTFASGGTITLSPGFSVTAGATFRAFTNTDSDGDGMPDYWESANGLNPAANDSAADPDGDGLNNLTEYLLGTSPSHVGTPDGSPGSIKLKVHQPNN